MKNILLLFASLILHSSCQSQPASTISKTGQAIYKYEKGSFLLLDSSSNKIDTILIFEAWAVSAVIDVKIFNDKCILIYRNGALIAFNSFEKRYKKWESVIGRELLTIRNETLPHAFEIIDENHIRVKEQKTNKVKTYELDYVKKQVSFTETTDR